MKADTIEIRVRYSETDQMGLVYNAHFLTYFEVARVEFLRKLGTAYRNLEERGCLLPVVEAHCRYVGRAGYDDVLELTTWVERLRPARIDFRHRVRRKADGAPVAEGHIVLACLDREGRPRRLPPEITEATDICETPPE